MGEPGWMRKCLSLVTSRFGQQQQEKERPKLRRDASQEPSLFLRYGGHVTLPGHTHLCKYLRNGDNWKAALKGKVVGTDVFLLENHSKAERLLEAANTGDVSTMGEILAIGSIPSCQLIDRQFWQGIKTNTAGNSPFHLAAKGNRLDVCLILWPYMSDLIEMLQNDKLTAIHIAAFNNSIRVGDFLLTQRKSLLQLNDGKFGRTVLHVAAQKGHLDFVKMLVEQHNADLLARSNLSDCENLPIHLAAFFGHREVIDYFLDKSPDLIDAKDARGNRPIHTATLGCQTKVVDWFIVEKGMSTDVRQERHGRTLLHQAAQSGCLELVKLLVEKHKVDVYARSNADDFEILPIHMAAWMGRLAVVCYFVENYSDLLKKRDAKGRTALKFAKLGKREQANEAVQVVQWLKSKSQH